MTPFSVEEIFFLIGWLHLFLPLFLSSLSPWWQYWFYSNCTWTRSAAILHPTVMTHQPRYSIWLTQKSSIHINSFLCLKNIICTAGSKQMTFHSVCNEVRTNACPQDLTLWIGKRTGGGDRASHLHSLPPLKRPSISGWFFLLFQLYAFLTPELSAPSSAAAIPHLCLLLPNTPCIQYALARPLPYCYSMCASVICVMPLGLNRQWGPGFQLETERGF